MRGRASSVWQAYCINSINRWGEGGAEEGGERGGEGVRVGARARVGVRCWGGSFARLKDTEKGTRYEPPLSPATQGAALASRV